MNIYETDKLLERIASRALRWRQSYDGDMPGTPALDKTVPNEQAARTAVMTLSDEHGWTEDEIYDSVASVMTAYISGTKPPSLENITRAKESHNGRPVNVIALWGYHSLFAV